MKWKQNSPSHTFPSSEANYSSDGYAFTSSLRSSALPTSRASWWMWCPRFADTSYIFQNTDIDKNRFMTKLPPGVCDESGKANTYKHATHVQQLLYFPRCDVVTSFAKPLLGEAKEKKKVKRLMTRGWPKTNYITVTQVSVKGVFPTRALQQLTSAFIENKIRPLFVDIRWWVKNNKSVAWDSDLCAFTFYRPKHNTVFGDPVINDHVDFLPSAWVLIINAESIRGSRQHTWSSTRGFYTTGSIPEPKRWKLPCQGRRRMGWIIVSALLFQPSWFPGFPSMQRCRCTTHDSRKQRALPRTVAIFWPQATCV